MDELLLVSVLMITYNHEKYIAESIENILNQAFHSSFELVIGEDFSTDSTRKICEQYANEHPDVVKLLPSHRNIGMMRNFVRTLKACRGKYIAVCEGDDYWTDDRKLQKQFELLESNSGVNLCFHRCTEWVELDKQLTYVPAFKRYRYTFFDFAGKGCFIHTCSIMFRNSMESIQDKFSEWTYQLSGADYLLYLLCTQGGHNALAINEIMAVYRIHSGGSWSGLSNLKRAEMLDNDLDLYKANLDLSREESVYLNFQLKRVVLGYLSFYLAQSTFVLRKFKRLIVFFFNRIYFIFGPGYASSFLALLVHPAIKVKVDNIKKRLR